MHPIHTTTHPYLTLQYTAIGLFFTTACTLTIGGIALMVFLTCSRIPLTPRVRIWKYFSQRIAGVLIPLSLCTLVISCMLPLSSFRNQYISSIYQQYTQDPQDKTLTQLLDQYSRYPFARYYFISDLQLHTPKNDQWEKACERARAACSKNTV